MMPSKFQVGNTMLVTLGFFLVWLPFMFNVWTLIAYPSGMLAFLGWYTVYQHRDRNHSKQSLDGLLFDNNELLEKAISQREEIMEKLELLRIQQREGD
jgi:hypothetical protein